MAMHPDGFPAIDIDAVTLRKAYADLKHAGSNVNQIARALNTRGAGAASVGEIDSALYALARAAEALSSALSITRAQ